MSYVERRFGEAAHIVGQTNSPRSPRGVGSELDEDARDTADNLMLLCDHEHDEIDKPGARDAFSVEQLLEMKQEHEDRVRLATEVGRDRATTPIRMVGRLRGRAMELDREGVARAVIAGAGRFARFAPATRNTLEIDLRNILGEEVPTEDYYRASRAMIDKQLAGLMASVAEGETTHISVFAWARIPLLVYLGSCLDDNVPVDVYQRHRSTDSWSWPQRATLEKFRVNVPVQGAAALEAVLLLNVSGTINPDEVPHELLSLPRFEITVDGATPGPDTISSVETLQRFQEACRQLLARLEHEGHKRVRWFHVLAAVPIAAAVEFGRVFVHEAHPGLKLYDRMDDGTYRLAFEIGHL
ncbi:SAVED domain-containing protein [Nakamurella sp. A5-74]|uniref:SAVED domain-containing protein n=1 Tax=Nakamurella sp. A5-74 TaxID=3158264 RepID=A0AAU8DS51_9ACTN